jgi:hypothetical protein
MKKLGFKFVGGTIICPHSQAIGVGITVMPRRARLGQGVHNSRGSHIHAHLSVHEYNMGHYALFCEQASRRKYDRNDSRREWTAAIEAFFVFLAYDRFFLPCEGA